MKILFVASEAAPFVKVGGLGEVMFSLPRALNKLGHDARVIIPRYASVNPEEYKLQMEHAGLEVPTDAQGENEPKFLICNVKRFDSGNLPRSPATTYFLENEEYYEKRANVYGYGDDAVRWALLSRGVLEWLKVSQWVPDIIVASDWQTGFLPNYLQITYNNDPKLSKIAAAFIIHNLYYQGMFDHRFVAEMDYDAGQAAVPSFFDPRLLKINAMRRGIMYADIISTVSPHYAKEITTPEYGELLDTLLRERRSRLYGVLNAIDYKVFNSDANPNLVAHYNVQTIDDRVKNKQALQTRFGLPQDDQVFVVGIVSRLIEQKGIDLLFPVMEQLLRELKLQLVVQGTGEAKYMSFFQELENRFKGQVAVNLSFDKDTPHLIYAGADAILIPSKFEPSGLVQMEAMRYGCVPIARATGGLADTVEDYNPAKRAGTGFVFNNFDSMSLVIAIARAFEVYHNPKAWQEIQKRAMEKDFSWKHSAADYLKVFEAARNLIQKAEE